MEYIKRDIETVIKDVARSYAAIIVTGPRQVGKTTMLKRLAGTKRTYVTLDDLEARRLAQRDPELFLSLNPAPILIDEVQYAPELFSQIKIAVDGGADAGSFWMTGSQTFRLMELAQESLAGRAAILRMSGLTQHEIYGKGKNKPMSFDVATLRARAKNGTRTDATGQYERVWKGSMPGHVSGKFPNREIFYGGYMQTYIQRDIGDMLARVDALLFEDFIRATACRTGQMLNVNDIAQDVGVTNDTAKRWLRLLEKSGVIFYLRPYSNNILKRTIKTPKMYFFDTGLVAYLTKYTSPDILMNGAINGAIFENYVVAEIIKSYINCGIEPTVYYYRDKDGKEIDMIVENDGKLHPIEIKKSASPSSDVVYAFKTLDAVNLPRGTGLVVCTKQDMSAINKDALIAPAWIV